MTLRRKSDSGFGELDTTVLPLALTKGSVATDPITRRQALVIEDINAKLEASREAAHLRGQVEHLTKLAYFDNLTGLPNQRRLEESFNEAVSKNEKMVLLFVDLNKFKQINDTYGHKIGDEALKLAAKTLASLTRATDIITHIPDHHSPEEGTHLPIRYAGDEFIILFTGATLENLQNKIGAVKNAFDNLKLKVGDEEIAVGASIGAYEYTPGDTLEYCKNQADIAMYADKKASKTQTTAEFDRYATGYPKQNSSVIPSWNYLSVLTPKLDIN